MKTTLILGFFDGVHLGHRAVIRSAVDMGKENHIVMLTFHTSPAEFFCGKTKYILSRENSIQRIKKLGVDEIIFQDFSKIYTQSAEEYLKNIVETYKPEIIATGFNYTFGKNKVGTSELLKQMQQKFEYKYICTLPLKYEHETVSSTLIKKYLQAGNISKANSLLEDNFILEGEVIHGQKIGRTIGFPTANINYPEKIIEIPYGAYAVKVDKYKGIMNYGIKPTLNGHSPIVEVHLLDFSDDLYGKNIKIEIFDKIRDEQKFNSLEELKSQIEKDKEKCLELL